MTFVFGALTGIMISQVSSGNRTTTPTARPAAPQPTADQAAAVQQLETHLSHSPNDVEARIQIGNIYFDSGQNESAILHYAKALELQPGNPNVIVDTGIAYRRIGQSDVSAKKFRKALTIDPRHVNARYNLGLVLMSDLGDIKGAVAAWDTLLLFVPNHPNAAWVREQLAEMKAGDRTNE